jgi:hypothetical protein
MKKKAARPATNSNHALGSGVAMGGVAGGGSGELPQQMGIGGGGKIGMPDP